MVVEDKYEFTAHESTKDGSSWTYSCKHRRTPKVKCHAKAKLVQFNMGSISYGPKTVQKRLVQTHSIHTKKECFTSTKVLYVPLAPKKC